ncbi:MAG: ABC transporter permease [Capsulimonadales bacterium]|nr:ABC transporter permease [Capsulimonadales bacterium]
MLRYTIRRLLYSIPILFGVLLITYSLFFGVTPPEIIARRNLSTRDPKPAQIEQWLADHGYGEPKTEEMEKDAFGRFLLSAGIKPKVKSVNPAEPPNPAEPATAPPAPDFRPSAAARLMQLKRNTVDVMLFQFGKSDSTKEDIWERLKKGAVPSFLIQAIIFGTGLFTALMLAVLVAYFRGTYIDSLATIVCVLMMSVVYMVYIIGLQYGMGRVAQYGPVWGFDPENGIGKFLLIPVVIGVIAGVGAEIRLYRTFLLDETGQDYVRTARAKGVPEGRILLGHVLKNALIPVITQTVSAIPVLILGGLLLENFFGIPGLGSYLNDAINSQDFAVVRAMVFLGALLTIVGQIMTDLLYAVVDPRIRLE